MHRRKREPVFGDYLLPVIQLCKLLKQKFNLHQVGNYGLITADWILLVNDLENPPPFLYYNLVWILGQVHENKSLKQWKEWSRRYPRLWWSTKAEIMSRENKNIHGWMERKSAAKGVVVGEWHWFKGIIIGVSVMDSWKCSMCPTFHSIMLWEVKGCNWVSNGSRHPSVLGLITASAREPDLRIQICFLFLSPM